MKNGLEEGRTRDGRRGVGVKFEEKGPTGKDFEGHVRCLYFISQRVDETVDEEGTEEKEEGI